MTNPLKEALLRQLPRSSDAKVAFVGIGSELRGDDAVGVVIINRLTELAQAARMFQDCRDARPCVSTATTKSAANPRFLFINGGSAPENVLGEIRAFQPEIIVFIDAAVLGSAPGTVQIIDARREKISGISFCTHSLPLTIIADYIRQTVPCEIFVIGIEPGDMDFRPDCALTPPVAQAAAETVKAIAAIAGFN